jgi:hypothetical protein
MMTWKIITVEGTTMRTMTTVEEKAIHVPAHKFGDLIYPPLSHFRPGE